MAVLSAGWLQYRFSECLEREEKEKDGENLERRIPVGEGSHMPLLSHTTQFPILMGRDGPGRPLYQVSDQWE